MSNIKPAIGVYNVPIARPTRAFLAAQAAAASAQPTHGNESGNHDTVANTPPQPDDTTDPEDYPRLGSHALEPSEPDFTLTRSPRSPIYEARNTSRDINANGVNTFFGINTAWRQSEDMAKPGSQTSSSVASHLLPRLARAPSSGAPLRNHTPLPTALICSCNQPARTFKVKISQCANVDCKVVWFHYACLQKAEKLRAIHGTMVCKECRVGEELKGKKREKGKGRMVQVQSEKEGKEESEQAREDRYLLKYLTDGLPGLGWVPGVVKPYGIGEEKKEKNTDGGNGGLDVAGSSKSEGEGVLGSLAFFGYVDSRPYQLTEAYMNAAYPATYAKESDGDEDEEVKQEETMVYGVQYYEDEDEEAEDLEDSDATLMCGETFLTTTA